MGFQRLIAMQHLRKRRSFGLRSYAYTLLVVMSVLAVYYHLSRPTETPARPPLPVLRPFCFMHPPTLSSPPTQQTARSHRRGDSAMWSADSPMVFHEWVDAVLWKHFGRSIAEAVYDSDMFNSAARNLASNKHNEPSLLSDSFVFTSWDPDPTHPDNFHNASNMLWWAKHTTSLSIARLSRDAETNKLYWRVAASGNPVKQKLFESTVVRALSAQVQYFHTLLQLMLDIAVSVELKRALQETINFREDVNALVLISGWITSSTTIAELDAVFTCSNVLRAVVLRRLNAVFGSHQSNRSQVGHVQLLFPLHYDAASYDEDEPHEGKFWNMIRPTAACSSMVRLCEAADGCRLLCNGEYLLFAGTSTAASVYNHRILGLGSNNQFDWELSLLQLFNSSTIATNGRSHGIGWMTTMDCTLTLSKGPRQWNIPAALRSSTVGHSGVSLCADGTTPNNAKPVLTPQQLKPFLLANEQSWNQPMFSLQQPILRSSRASADVLKNPARGTGREHHLFRMMPQRPNASVVTPPPRWFDALSIYKMDIEGFEWNAVPEWLRDELHSVGGSVPELVSMGATEPIDFEDAVKNHFSVSLFSLEVHRIGHIKPVGRVADGALRMHWFMTHMYALGYLLVGHEKNENSGCCFEHTFVHVRHFIRSEMWMALRDDL